MQQQSAGTGFHRVCKTSDIPEGGKEVFEVEDRFIVVFHLDGEFYALDDCCTHDGGPLGQGDIVEGFAIRCPRHGAKFDIRDGRARMHACRGGHPLAYSAR